MKFLLVAILLTTSIFSKNMDSEIKKAIIKIYTTAKVPSYKKPWINKINRSSGSGAVIRDNLILTNAHVVANQTYIEVQRYDVAKRYIAKVIMVSHELDLALITTEDKSFFKGIKALDIGELPNSEDNIFVYGYPMGGKTLSVTSGVVSRIEHQNYVHSGLKFLATQVDAAINPGNSGGPAIIDRKIVGVVMQGITYSQNIGYLVSTPMIKHFLKDIEDNKIDGVPQMHIFVSKLNNPAAKRYYDLDINQTGIVVTRVMPLGNCANKLKKGDVILNVDGKNIENDGTVSFREGEYTSAKYLTDLHQFGETIELKIWRDHSEHNITVTLDKRNSDVWLVRDYQYDRAPTYFIYGGYLFSPLVENLINTGKSKNCSIYTLLNKFATTKKREQVILLGVFADRSNRGNQNLYKFLPKKINGEDIIDFKDFYKKMSSKKDGFIILEDSSKKEVIIDVKEAQERHKRILQIYNVEFDRSKDLRDSNSTNSI